MTSKRISALIMLLLIFSTMLMVGVKSYFSGSEFPKYNRFFFMAEYMEDIETFVKENFPGGEQLENSAVYLQRFLGKNEFDGIFLGEDMLIEDIGQPDEKLMQNNLYEVRKFVEMASSTPMSVLYLPTKYAIKQQELPDFAENFAFNQKSFIEKNYASLSGKATTVDAYSPLLSNSDKYLYYRSAPDLTGLGAYYVYSALVQRMGQSPLPQSDFTLQHFAHDFYGETYENSPFKDISPDIVTLYHPTNQSTVSVTHFSDYKYTYNTLYPAHKTGLDVILGGNTGDITISSGLKRQRSLLVLGDSSIMPVLPLLSAHYYNIRFIDFENWNDKALKELDVEEYDQVLIAYSVDSMIHESYPAQLRQLRLQQESRMENTEE